jgi:hypothetical protein
VGAVSDLEEFEVIEAVLVSFATSSDNFHLPADIDGSLGLVRPRDSRTFQIGDREIEFRTH